MNHTQSLPEPSSDALKHSQNLVARIRQEIENNQGHISFRRYMEMALYEPKLGYYVAGTNKFGEGGDFITAPEISPLFSQCIAEQCAQVISRTQGNILEFGAGSGLMAADILLSLEKLNALPETYYIFDVSPDLKARQKETIKKRAPHLQQSVQWLEKLPHHFEGIVLGNEVLDAMPVTLFTQQGTDVYEHHVIWENGQLREQLQPASQNVAQDVLALSIPAEATPYTSEINPNLAGWFDTLFAHLKKGVMLLIDYGYTQKEYYLDERNKGTLICHYQHLVNEAPLYYPGLQDITANVNFTAVAEAAYNAGFKVAGYTSQAAFLNNAGLEKHFMQALDTTPDAQYKLAQQIRTLSLPSEMGERFKVIALSKDLDEPLVGFKAFDQRHKL